MWILPEFGKGLDCLLGYLSSEVGWNHYDTIKNEDVHMNIEAALTDLIGEPAKKLHTARSRNDHVATDFRLWRRDAIDTIIVKIKLLQTSLVQLALKNEALSSLCLKTSHYCLMLILWIDSSTRCWLQASRLLIFCSSRAKLGTKKVHQEPS